MYLLVESHINTVCMTDALLLKAACYFNLYVIKCLAVPKHVAIEVLDIVSCYYLLYMYVYIVSEQ